MTISGKHFETEIENNAKIIELHPHEGNMNFTVHTKQEGEAPAVFTNIKRESIISALKKNNELDAHAAVLFNGHLQSFIDHGYQILLFYNTMDGVAVEVAMMEEGIAPIKHRMVVSPQELCDALGVKQSELHNHDLSVTLVEFLKMKKEEGVELEVDAYKKVKDHFLVHLSGEGDFDQFTFADVPAADLAKAMKKKQSELKSKMNETMFKEKSGKMEEKTGTRSRGSFNELIEKGGRIVEAELNKKGKIGTMNESDLYEVKVQVGDKVTTFPNVSGDHLKNVPGFQEAISAGEMEE